MPSRSPGIIQVYGGHHDDDPGDAEVGEVVGVWPPAKPAAVESAKQTPEQGS